MTSRILQCRIELDGQPREPRSYIELGEKGGADGMTMERNGALWVCLPKAQTVERYDSRGHLTARVHTNGMPIACALSEDDQTLYIVGAETLPEGTSVFTAIANQTTRGWLAQAHIGSGGKAQPAHEHRKAA
jgi:sugar lactone lactonase YvrE